VISKITWRKSVRQAGEKIVPVEFKPKLNHSLAHNGLFLQALHLRIF
jgi:hypothetical protein